MLNLRKTATKSSLLLLEQQKKKSLGTEKAEEPSTTPQAEPLERKAATSEATDSKAPSLPATAPRGKSS